MNADLNFVSTRDLIKELTSRQTFAGLILYSPEEHKGDEQIHNQFHLLTTTSVEGTEELLMRALDCLRHA